MIKFKKIRLKNYKNIGGSWVELDFDDTGFYRISGTNGTGKTTILSALTFALFGKNSDMRNDSKVPISTAELINDLNKKELVVELFLENGMLIRRGLKPDFFELIDADGINLADKSSKTIDQNFLEQEVLDGMSFQMFHKLTYVSSKAISTPFLYMTPSQRKEFLEHVLDIRLIYYVGEEIKARLSAKKLDLMTYNNNRANAEQNVKAEEANIQRLNEQRESQIATIKDLTANKKAIIDQMSLKSEEAKKTRDLAKNAITTLTGEISKLETELQEWVVKVDSVRQAQWNLLQINASIQDVAREIANLEKNREMFYSNLEGFKTCGTCDRLKLITGEFDEVGYQASVNELQKKIEIANTHVQVKNEIIAHQEEYNAGYANANTALETKKMMKAKAEGILSEQLGIIESAETLIRQMNQDVEAMKPIEISYAHLESLKVQLLVAENAYDKVKSEIEQLERIKSRVGDKTLHKQVMEQYVPIFQAKVNELLCKFMEDDPFSFSLEFDEAFNITGKKNGKESNIFKLSEGQKTSIHFAILFAMMYIIGLKNANNATILMIDEILDLSLDASRVDKVVQYLKDLSSDRLIILISHNDDISAEYFDKIINVTKVYNFSHYEIL